MTRPHEILKSPQKLSAYTPLMDGMGMAALVIAVDGLVMGHCLTLPGNGVTIIEFMFWFVNPHLTSAVLKLGLAFM